MKMYFEKLKYFLATKKSYLMFFSTENQTIDLLKTVITNMF